VNRTSHIIFFLVDVFFFVVVWVVFVLSYKRKSKEVSKSLRVPVCAGGEGKLIQVLGRASMKGSGNVFDWTQQLF